MNFNELMEAFKNRETVYDAGKMDRFPDGFKIKSVRIIPVASSHQNDIFEFCTSRDVAYMVKAEGNFSFSNLTLIKPRPFRVRLVEYLANCQFPEMQPGIFNDDEISIRFHAKDYLMIADHLQSFAGADDETR